MTRLEENSKDQVGALQNEIESLKKNLKRKQSKKLLNCGTCLLLFVFFCLLLGGCLAYALAKSGLAVIPYLTKYYYREPEPSYLVNTDKLSIGDKNLANLIQKAGQAEALKQEKITDIKIKIELSEAQTTSFLREQIQNNSAFKGKIDYIQAAILADSLELFIKLKEPKIFLTFNVLPKVKNNKLDLELKNFKIGNLKMPRFIGSLGSMYLLEQSTNKLLASLAGNFQLDNLTLAPISIIVEILFKQIKP
jgi:hypothetical protein